MAVDSNSYFKYQEHRGQSGYKAAILVKEQGETYYSLLVASETVPSVFGSNDSFDFDLLNSPVKGKIMGKMSLDDKEVEVLHHRDNVYRFEKLKGKVLDFLVMDSQFVGYKFTGTLSYRMNDATADVLRGTYTITPMSADPNPVLDCRSLVQETLCFADVIPEEATSNDSINISIVQSGVSATYKIFTISASGAEGTKTTISPTSGVYALSGTVTSAGTEGLYGIEVSASGYGSWVTTIYVKYVAAT